MRGTQFAELNAFVAVAERGNFTKAATHLGISPATLSQTIRELEERLGVRLLNRTTRSVALTEAGERLLARLRPVLDDYEAAIDSVNSFRDRPAGWSGRRCHGFWSNIPTSASRFRSPPSSSTSWRTISTPASGSGAGSIAT
jgi:DNA-binding transcriptional LysR family regulator